MPQAASHMLQAGEYAKITNVRNLLAPAVRLLRRAALSVAELLRSDRGVSKIVWRRFRGSWRLPWRLSTAAWARPAFLAH